MTIKVFISYSWDSDAHKHTVLQFSDKLREHGIDCFIDQYINGSPPETWTRWMKKQIEAADFVLVVCTETYLKRFNGEDTEAGRGVNFEGVIIAQELYDAFQHSTKFIPVIPDDGNIDHVPLDLKGKSIYKFVSQFETIWRVLADQPLVSPKPLGELKLPQINTQSLSKLTPYLHQTPDKTGHNQQTFIELSPQYSKNPDEKITAQTPSIIHVTVHEKGKRTALINDALVILVPVQAGEGQQKETNKQGAVNFTIASSTHELNFFINAEKADYKAGEDQEISIKAGHDKQIFIELNPK
ncbi:MAG: toll/interleukin-1 receptor domain-containing protein [Methylococcales bacterium]